MGLTRPNQAIDSGADILRPLLLTCALLPSIAISSTDWDSRFERELTKCMAIPAGKFATAILLNPNGMRSYYKRSACLQEVAIKWRNISLCAKVKERRSLFFSSYAFSEKTCREKVAEKQTGDRLEASSVEAKGIYQLSGIEFERVMYGEYFKVHLHAEGGFTNTYDVLIEIWPEAGSEPVKLDSFQSRLTSTKTKHPHFIRTELVRNVLGPTTIDRPVRVRVTLSLMPNSQSEQFVFPFIPIENRTSRIELHVNFARL